MEFKVKCPHCGTQQIARDVDTPLFCNACGAEIPVEVLQQSAPKGARKPASTPMPPPLSTPAPAAPTPVPTPVPSQPSLSSKLDKLGYAIPVALLIGGILLYILHIPLFPLLLIALGAFLFLRRFIVSFK